MLKMQNPFPGLRPFEANEKHLFFGRERHVADILRKLEKFRFVSVVGNSGSGKSSLVRAGLLPTIEKEGDWLVCVMRPGKNPIAQLADSLLDQNIISLPEGKSRTEFLEGQYKVLEKSNLGVIQVVRNFVPKGKKLLLLIDQFEEIFRFNAIETDKEEYQHATHFVDLLLAAAAQRDVPIYAMLTLRSDFLGDCEQFMGLPEAINDGQFLVPRMNREDLSLCLTGPVSYADGKISPRLVQQLLNEIGNNPDQLPILQHVLMRTWKVWMAEGRLEQPMDVQHYEQTGGMEMALSNHAEEAYAELKTAKGRLIAQTLFKTITVKGADNRGVRRPTTVSKVAKIAKCSPEEIIRIANIFRRADRGFIMPPEKIVLDENSILDISHESLMRAWERLGIWVQEEADSAELYQRISESALLYEQERAGLWRDPDLQIAVDWRAKNDPNEDWAQQYNSHFTRAMRFVEASESEKRFMHAERARRNKVIRAAVIVFLLMLSGLSIWAISERNNSLANARLATNEKIKADHQAKLAEEQTEIAKSNYEKAKEEELKAQDQKREAEKQRKLALLRAEEARIAKLKAETESTKSREAKKAAERDRGIAEKQKSLSDSLRGVSEKSEKNAKRLRILSLAQSMAIKSRLADKNTLDQDLKSLLALQAFRFNQEYGGKEMDLEVFSALFSSVRMYQKQDEYMHKYHNDLVKSVCYNGTNGDLASTGDDGKVIISPASGQSKIVLTNPQLLLYDNISYDKSGKYLAVTCDNNNLFIFSTTDIAATPREIKNLHRTKIIGVEWFGDKVITACLDSAIRVINLKTEKIESLFKTDFKPVSIDFCQTTNKLFVGSETGTIYWMDIVNDKKFSVFKEMPGERINCLCINETGELLGVGTSQCMVINVSNKMVRNTLYGHKSGITHVAFNKASNKLASSCMDQRVRLYNITEEGSPPMVFTEHENWVMDVAFSPDGKQLASCSKDKTVRIYPTDPNAMANFLSQRIKRNLSAKEWETYIGNDVSYQKTIAGL